MFDCIKNYEALFDNASFIRILIKKQIRIRGRNMTTKLTLSVEPAIIEKARRISKHRKTSVSAMFSNYIASLEEESAHLEDIPPITKRILEMGAKLPKIPADWDYRDELSDIIAESHGVK